MHSLHSLRIYACSVMLAAIALGLWSPMSFAGESAQVDLSVSVSMTPATFVPGGHGTFTVTVHNAGPDTAGDFPDLGNVFVYGGDFIVTNQPSPFELVEPWSDECWIERAVTEPLPDGNIALLFIYYFGSVPAGESRSCTTGIEFYPSTRNSFLSTWEAYTPSELDIDQTNDEIEYVFRLRPTAVPVTSPTALILLGLCLVGVAGLACRRTAALRPKRRIR